MAMGMPAHQKQVRHDFNPNPMQLIPLTYTTPTLMAWKQLSMETTMMIPLQTTPNTDHKNKTNGNKWQMDEQQMDHMETD